MPPLTPKDLTLAEKAALTSGADTWRTSAIERLGLGQILLTDGPHGVRKEAGSGGQPALDNSLPATCFPPAVGLAAHSTRNSLPGWARPSAPKRPRRASPSSSGRG